MAKENRTERKTIERMAEKENRTPKDFCRSVVLEAIKKDAGK